MPWPKRFEVEGKNVGEMVWMQMRKYCRNQTVWEANINILKKSKYIEHVQKTKQTKTYTI